MAELAFSGGSAVVQAGAGTGKTHNLVSLCVQLLGGAQPLPPAKLWAVTFTEKAAAELKGRIRARVDELALRDPAFRRVRRDLGLAQIGTIHSLCVQILRRHPAAAGVDPGFRLLDEAQGARFLREACETAALRGLEGALGPAAASAARRLCAEMGLRTQGRFGTGLADELSGLLRRVGETDAALEQFVQEPARATEEYQRALARLSRALADLHAALSKNGKQAPPPLARAVLECPPGQLAQAWGALRLSSPNHLGARGPDKDAITAAKDAFTALLEADAGVRGSALAADLVLLARQATARHREMKARAGALDFDDLTRLCSDLLLRDAAACAAERERVGALLVDEFQDTSRAQIELLEQLGRGRTLVVVGDRKQSIYEFRGADVAGAQAFAGRLLQGGAERLVLGESRRSRPALVEFANLLFSRALAGSGRPFD
ncbi:MAG TPA: UvrD-helicase domain-containing protein, partial [Myxococcales bacterium]